MPNIFHFCSDGEGCDTNKAGSSYNIADGKVFHHRRNNSKTQQEMLVNNIHIATQNDYNVIKKPVGAKFPNNTLNALTSMLMKNNDKTEHFNFNNGTDGTNRINNILIVLALLILLYVCII